MYIAMSLIKEIPTNTTCTVNAASLKYRTAGVLMVFETKAAAQEVFGPDVELMQVEFAEPEQKSA